MFDFGDFHRYHPLGDCAKIGDSLILVNVSHIQFRESLNLVFTKGELRGNQYTQFDPAQLRGNEFPRYYGSSPQERNFSKMCCRGMIKLIVGSLPHGQW
jgi:hypothetical protein